ncbi:hypothetical protein C2S52_017696 [Perilla frutescens var. hirtella]|uniref:BHLH domain-containing protein n=1 Tax=Perilla frutescens var. hirtella TaxID=608512 RepID=A0AAD4IZE7_PERFH|nr:hypothetical protein C2S52_017696 [Perilla frutescens var. hirtella]KAH6823818.1 hypothetical protein C2S53_006933 [Perilla frutescens var. hirtella]
MNSHHQQFEQNTQMGSGLTRYRSAPSSYFASLLSNPTTDDGFIAADDFEQLFNPRATSPDTQIIFSRFMNSNDAAVQENRESNTAAPPPQPLLLPRKSEAEEFHQPQQHQLQQSNDYSNSAAVTSQMMYGSHNSASAAAVFASFNSNCAAAQPKMERAGAAPSGLIRHSSSPAGLFANINIENDFKTMRGVGSYGGGNSANAEASFSSASRFMSQMDYSSSRHTTSRIMDPISEIGSKGMGENTAGDAQYDEDHGNDVDYITGLPINSWDDSALLSDHYLKGVADNDQKHEGGNQPKTLLSHHLSLPKSSGDLSAIEKLLQDSVPCKIRAKRGFATHPRSIAERVRRTKISERMRKLQELVPNMEKQTNTSDMLDLAVDYIKDLQRQVKQTVPALQNNTRRSKGYQQMIKDQRPVRII